MASLSFSQSHLLTNYVTAKILLPGTWAQHAPTLADFKQFRLGCVDQDVLALPTFRDHRACYMSVPKQPAA